MVWKKLPYWLKCGIIFSLLYVLFFILSLGDMILYVLAIIPGAYFVPFISGCNTNSFDTIKNLCVIYPTLAINIPIYFIIGAITGLIIQKIKSKK